MLENEPVTGTEGGLKRWLEGVGLGHYTDLFAQHRLDLDVMGDLTESDLVELGLPLGDRKRLQRAMSALFHAETAEKPDTAARPQVRAEVGAERRQLTTMFCDMVDSTSLSVQFDPEDPDTVELHAGDQVWQIDTSDDVLIRRNWEPKYRSPELGKR